MNSIDVSDNFCRANDTCASDGSIAQIDDGAHFARISSVNAPLPQPISIQVRPASGASARRPRHP
jgi:hypothetical protein